MTAVINSEPIEQTGTWLYKLATNKITDKYRKRSETLLDDLFFARNDEDGDDDYRAILSTEATTPETKYLRNLFWDQLFLALGELLKEQRQVFIWQEVDHVSFQEITDNMGENVHMLVSRKRYAVLHLRKSRKS